MVKATLDTWPGGGEEDDCGKQMAPIDGPHHQVAVRQREEDRLLVILASGPLWPSQPARDLQSIKPDLVRLLD